MESVQKQKDELEGHELFIIKIEEVFYTDSAQERRKRNIYDAYDATTKELVQFKGALIMDLQDLDDTQAQTLLIFTDKSGKQFWHWELWKTAPYVRPARETNPGERRGGRGGKVKQMKKLLRVAIIIFLGSMFFWEGFMAVLGGDGPVRGIIAFPLIMAAESTAVVFGSYLLVLVISKTEELVDKKRKQELREEMKHE